MKIFAETERLLMRELLPSDVDGMYELDADPEVHQYLGKAPVTNKERSLEVIHIIRQQYIDNGIGRWAVIDKSSGAFLGWSGLKLMTTETNGHINYYDLGYRFIKKYWGRGIATETAFMSLDYAFHTLHATEVFAMADCENAGSDNVLRKAGLRFIETFEFEGDRHNWYKICKAEFENHKRKAS